MKAWCDSSGYNSPDFCCSRADAGSDINAGDWEGSRDGYLGGYLLSKAMSRVHPLPQNCRHFFRLTTGTASSLSSMIPCCYVRCNEIWSWEVDSSKSRYCEGGLEVLAFLFLGLSLDHRCYEQAVDRDHRGDIARFRKVPCLCGLWTCKIQPLQRRWLL